MASETFETLEAGDKEVIDQAIEMASDVERENKLKGLLESKAINLKSINERNKALRAHIESRFTPDQREQRDSILANLKKAHDKTLTKMREEGKISLLDEGAQRLAPEWKTKTKMNTALVALAVAPLAIWGALKWFGRKTKETTVAAAKVTKNAAVKTTGFFGKALAVTSLGILGLGIFDQWAWGGEKRKQLARYIAGEKKAPSKEEKETVTV